jgi:fluoride exporter
MKEFFYVFLGGGLGSMCRYGLGRLIILSPVNNFPVATLVINILASLLLGTILGYLDLRAISNPALKLLLAVGFCGGFSTFSTFSYETLLLLRHGQMMLALGNIFLSVALCLTATLAGFYLARAL